jgi:hypothetical protein
MYFNIAFVSIPVFKCTHTDMEWFTPGKSCKKCDTKPFSGFELLHFYESVFHCTKVHPGRDPGPCSVPKCGIGKFDPSNRYVKTNPFSYFELLHFYESVFPLIRESISEAIKRKLSTHSLFETYQKDFLFYQKVLAQQPKDKNDCLA